MTSIVKIIRAALCHFGRSCDKHLQRQRLVGASFHTAGYRGSFTFLAAGAWPKKGHRLASLLKVGFSLFKNCFSSFENRAFREPPNLKWKYHNLKKYFDFDSKKYGLQGPKNSKMGGSKNGGIFMTLWGKVRFESGLRSQLSFSELERFLVTPFVPCHQAGSLVNSSALSAAVDQGVSLKEGLRCNRALAALVSLEMLILSEFEAFEPTQGMLRMHHLAPRPSIQALSAPGAWSGV